MTEETITPITIKKYANRRLYNMQSSTYVTLEDLCEMVKKGEEFVVVDAKTGEDLTRTVLTQIIFEQEAKGYNLLPLSFLRHIISFYDHNVSSMVPAYLEQAMEQFSEYQKQVHNATENLNPMPGMRSLEQIQRQQMEWMETAFSMFNPFGPTASSKNEDNTK